MGWEVVAPEEAHYDLGDGVCNICGSENNDGMFCCSHSKPKKICNILVIDDTPEKVAHLKELENDKCKVTFVETFVEARRVVKFNPDTFDKIYLDHDLDKKFTGVQLLQFLVSDKGLKPGCRIIPNSASEKCNFKIKAEIVRLKLTRRETRKKLT